MPRVLGVLLLLAVLAGCTGRAEPEELSADPLEVVESPGLDMGGVTEPAVPVPESDDRPNIVFVFMDDFSLELIHTMPEALRMMDEGATYDNAFVIDSLCCPSRASIFTGQTPRQHGVLVNTPNDPDEPIGAWPAWWRHGNGEKSVAVTLQDAGYTTGFTGKFMNLYRPTKRADGTFEIPVEPGWDEWRPVLGGAYDGWGYRTIHPNGRGGLGTKWHREPPVGASPQQADRSYAGSFIADKAVDFIEERRDEEAPYFLAVAPYAPHGAINPPGEPVFPPAMGDRSPAGDPAGGNCGARDCADLSLADLVGYDDPRGDNAPTYLHDDGTTSPAPAWRTNPIRITDAKALRWYRQRAQMVQSVDRMLGRIRTAIDDDTYLVLTSDNGFHLGQHQLNGGKGAPYDSDTRVPLVVTGPGVVPGARQQFVNNIDLASTFEELAGTDTPDFRSGRSFADTLTDPTAEGAEYAFFEHTWAKIQPGEVDLDESAGGTIDIIPSYLAVRGERGLLVRVDLDPGWEGTDHAWELYDYAAGFEDRNIFAEAHDEPWARDLMERLHAWEDCEPAACRAAAD